MFDKDLSTHIWLVNWRKGEIDVRMVLKKFLKYYEFK